MVTQLYRHAKNIRKKFVLGFSNYHFSPTAILISVKFSDLINSGRFYFLCNKKLAFEKVWWYNHTNMKVYAISDLHLSLSGEKPMEVFGDKWQGYLDKIKYDWQNKVGNDDVVLISGDISWAMKLENAVKDFEFFNDLKGKKIIIRGNHDYWWQGITKIREVLPENFYALQNDSVKIGNIVFCGSRGWAVEGSPDFNEHDRHIYLREVERFKLALKSAKQKLESGDKLVCLIHYPPFNVRKEKSLFTELFEEYKVDKVVYGHLHGKGVVPYHRLNLNGTEYILSSCDLIENKLVEVY